MYKFIFVCNITISALNQTCTQSMVKMELVFYVGTIVLPLIAVSTLEYKLHFCRQTAYELIEIKKRHDPINIFHCQKSLFHHMYTAHPREAMILRKLKVLWLWFQQSDNQIRYRTEEMVMIMIILIIIVLLTSQRVINNDLLLKSKSSTHFCWIFERA